MTKSTPAEELRSLGIRPSRSMGQHFLVEEKIADWMVDRAGITEDQHVLEIGPGLGILTERILARTSRLTAIEKDRRLAAHLEQRWAAHLEQKYGMEIISADAMKCRLPEFDKVVSNLPYQISSAITMKMLDQGFEKGLLMYQKEFAGHLVAPPGTRSYSRISVMTQYRADCEVVKHVSKGCFYPVPKVDSTIVEITPRPPDFHIASGEMFRIIVRVLFSHKNRKVRNGIMSEWGQLGLTKEEAREISDGLPNADRRPVKLSPEELAEIANAYILQKN